MLENYYTIHSFGTAEIEIKGSRFICHLERVEDEVSALEFIQSIKKTHWKATHNCSAFLIGENDYIQRAFDDGEPSGTAGIPMLEVLKKNQLKNVVCVVTRYFGGTKLGAGGLIRAYAHAVSEGLRTVGIVHCTLEEHIQLSFAYSLLGKLEYELTKRDIMIVQKDYAEVVHLTCSIPIAQSDAFEKDVVELVAGQVTCQRIGTHYTQRLVDPS